MHFLMYPKSVYSSDYYYQYDFDILDYIFKTIHTFINIFKMINIDFISILNNNKYYLPCI